MDDLGTVGGVPRLADRGAGRHGFAQQRHGRRGDDGRAAAADRADVSAAAAVAMPLLRERTLAAARGAFGDAAALPPGGTPADGSPSPQQVVDHLLHDVRWLAARSGASCPPAALAADVPLRVLLRGADDAEAVLRDVGRLDDALAAWFAAVRDAMRVAAGDAED
jgi:hypothetical protein